MARFEVEFSEISNAIKRLTENIPRQDMQRERFEHLDIARGIAIALMFLSHTVMALNTYKMLPDYGLVPIHTITKFSSSLFILTFGLSLALFYLPSYGTEKWPKRRWRLVWRAFNILIWYKLLTIVQMFQTYDRQAIIDTLLFKRFTDFAEVLNFYWLAILWLVLLIPIWVRIAWPLKVLLTVGFAAAGVWLNQNVDFFGVWQIKAMLVEHKGAYCFGQLQRGALILFGLLLGGLLADSQLSLNKKFSILGILCLFIGALSFGYFLYLTRESDEVRRLVILAITKNFGKHPPNLHFSAFSLGGAFTIMGLCLLVPNKLTGLLKPFSIIGKEAFFCFNYHLVLIFVVYRYFLELRWKLSYEQTMIALLVVFISAVLLAPINTYIKKQGVFWKWILP